MKPKTTNHYFVKFLALFTVVRGYNVAMLVLAMYFTAYFIFSKNTSLIKFLSHWHLHFIILASAFTVSAGYIINNFYDLDKDRIGRPVFAYMAKFVSQNFKLTIYVIFNVIALIFACLASWRVALFFIFFQFATWFYSHKLNRIIFINNLTSTILSLLPFLAILLYYNNYSKSIFIHAGFLGLNLLCLDLTKDLLTVKADAIYNYNTLPVSLGIKKSKIVLSLCLIFTTLFGFILTKHPEIGYMSLYFKTVSIIFLLLAILIFFIKEQWQWRVLLVIFKILLGLGVISLAWIRINPLDLHKFFEI
ncbi:geranylgeranylglycerol-phosphate geranylgeranyltransferase [Weeksellaceae bacterium TAE3-ERU29]|nr:geranylgeranylglycerol-phosphate geranylgeranyltransferase [Weeksellaceae bacterium TAE3-ERU29]